LGLKLDNQFVALKTAATETAARLAGYHTKPAIASAFPLRSWVFIQYSDKLVESLSALSIFLSFPHSKETPT